MGFNGKPKFVSFDTNGTLIHFRVVLGLPRP
jgi:hypothetical protein